MKKILLTICAISLAISIGSFAFYSYKQSKAEKALGSFAENSGCALLSNSLSLADMITLTRDMQEDMDELSSIKLTKWITASTFGVISVVCGVTLLILKRKEEYT